MKKQETRDSSLAKGGPSKRTHARGGRGALKEHRRAACAKIPRVKWLVPGLLELEPVHDEENLAFFNASVQEATGTLNDEAGYLLLAQATVGSFPSFDPRDFAYKIRTAMALLHGIEPKDSVEGMLAVQMVGTHNLAMNFLELSQDYRQPIKELNEHINRAAKFLRLYTAQLETLGKYRNRGKQKITVEHVHVNAGGQAVVGIVEREPGGEEGKMKRTKQKPYANPCGAKTRAGTPCKNRGMRNGR